MSLVDRLRRMGALRGLVAPEAPETTADPETASGGERSQSLAVTGPDRELLPRTVTCTNMHGTFLLREADYGLEHVHGTFSLGRFLDCEQRTLEILARNRSLGNLDLSRAAFLDTETTGLSGGTGTIAFLVGLARLEDGVFRVRQLFVRDFDEETAMLYQLGLLLEGASCLVTYNGKSFDVPLLVGRYVANRLRGPDLYGMPHLDLLHSARRLWRHEFAELSLGCLERAMLGIERTGDVPGALIPALYVRYLTTKRADLMEPVLHHNELDVLSLATVLAAGARACRGEGERPGECYGMARTLDLLRETEEAAAGYRRALERVQEPALERRVRKDLAAVLARGGRFNESETEWAVVAEKWQDLDALEALAKAAEHRHRDFARAVALVKQALARLHSPLLRSVASQGKRRSAFQARLSRLERKLEA
ncbi:MAG: ribonuclease H-like domain-containing protein [Candidatus Riflebacteria bacterium]|nr:ribonuclease H-like domain-containing protein [Candidatus Riflebacteria bacterium]